MQPHALSDSKNCHSYTGPLVPESVFVNNFAASFPIRGLFRQFGFTFPISRFIGHVESHASRNKALRS
jgi:hypothetical protein